MTKGRYAAEREGDDPKSLTRSGTDLLFAFFTMNDVEGKKALSPLSAIIAQLLGLVAHPVGIPGPCGGCGPNGYPSTIEIAVFQHQQSILDDAQQFANDGYTGKYVGGCVLFWKTGDGEPYDLQAYIDVMNMHCS